MDTMTTLKLRTEHFTVRVSLTRSAFQARIERADESATTTVEQAGYVEVLKGDIHIARYLTAQEVLWYETAVDHQKWREEQAERTKRNWPRPWMGESIRRPSVDDPWPPFCPECGFGMKLKFNRRTNEPFWSCRLFDSPGRVCRGRSRFTLHPAELAEYKKWSPPSNPYWSLQANKTRDPARYQHKWAQLAALSVERWTKAQPPEDGRRRLGRL
ncbi:MAG: hypothetical protein GY842_08515 [bacterium]|nr:hypothetical protein [bacterium]